MINFIRIMIVVLGIALLVFSVWLTVYGIDNDDKSALTAGIFMILVDSATIALTLANLVQ